MTEVLRLEVGALHTAEVLRCIGGPPEVCRQGPSEVCRGH